MHPIVFSIGPINITLLGVFSVLGILVALRVARAEARRKMLDEATFQNGILLVLVAGLVGSRLFYAAVFDPETFFAQPMRVFALHEGGLSIQGGLLGGVLAGLLYFRGDRGSFLRAGDAVVPAVILAQAIARIGCDVFGVPADPALPWAVAVGEESLHPVQIYESMLNYLLFVGLWSIRDRTSRDGELFFLYIAAFGLNRFVVEFFRTNPEAIGGLTVAHVTSVAMIGAASAGLFALRRFARPGSSGEVPVTSRSNRRAALGVAGLMIASVVTYYGIYGYLIHL